VFLYRLVEGGADRSYGVQVARLAGVPDHVVERAREVMGQLTQGQEAGGRGQEGEGGKKGAMALQEIGAPYLVEEGQERGVRGRGAPGRLLVPAGDEVVWAVLRELFGLDVANLTPVRALVMVNDWQQRLRGENHG
jgi:DNA mismatch repair protein MutS